MNTHTFLKSKIYDLRQQKIMLDFDLAGLYEIETKALNQAVKRNLDRFPIDFMFRLSIDEWEMMRSQFVTASQNKRNNQVTPYAFTEQGVAMLSGVLKSAMAINVNIAIMRTFVQLRQLTYEHAELFEKIKMVEAKYDTQFSSIFEAIGYLMHKEDHPEIRKRIGFKN